ncbi:MAG: hypothetical protein IIB11_01600 [Chloroflexi bacterium]|nr:hypothetical protein [Chloroflexota bacterium]
MSSTAPFLTPYRVLEELKGLNISHIVWLPDTESRFLYDAMVAEPSLEVIPVCREGETIPIAMGLMLGGQRPICMIQSTGFYESGDAVRGLALDVKLPLLLLIGYRGWKREGPIVDSAATFLEPVLDAWGINRYLVETDDDVPKISQAYREAQEKSMPVAVLIGAEYQQ